MADTTTKVRLVIEGQDSVTPAATTAAASVKRFGDEAQQATAKARSFGDNLADLKPKADTISSAFGVMAAGAAAVTGVFIKAAQASEQLGGQLSAVGGAANDSFRALGDAIAASDSWNRAVSVMIGGFGELTKWIESNKRTIDDLVRSALSPLARAAIVATQMVAGLAEAVVVLSNIIRPYLTAVGGTVQTAALGPSAAYGAFTGFQQGGLGGALGGAWAGIKGGPSDWLEGMRGIWEGIKASERTVLSIDEASQKIQASLADLETMMATGGGGSGEGAEITMPAMIIERRQRGGRAAARQPSPYSFRGTEPNMGDVYAAEQSRQQAASMASARGNLAAGKAYQSGVWGAASAQSGAYAQQIAEAAAAQEQAAGVIVASADTLASAFLSLAVSGASASEMMRGLAQSGFSAAASAAGSLIPGWQGQAISAGIGLVGGLFSAMTASPARRQREYTVQDPLPVKVVNKEDLQQVTIYNVTVAGSGLLQKAQTARLVGQAMRAQDRTGGGAPATPR